MRINDLITPNLFSKIKIGTKTDPSLIDSPKGDINPANELTQWQKNENNESHNSPKWDLRRVPLRYFVSRQVNHDKFLPDFTNAVKSSFLPWSRASYGLIRFVEVADRNHADIIINWSDMVTLGRDFETGHNNLKIISNKIQKAEITIIIYPIIDTLASSASRIERVRRTALHEMGHALGLNHSTNSKDIMFHRGINNKSLSSNDMIRLNELYEANKPIC